LFLGQPTAYTVTPISPYTPPYQFGCLANPVSVNIDDVWSPVVTLPFNFCFYGNNYNQCLIGSNGVLTFDLVNNTPAELGLVFYQYTPKRLVIYQYNIWSLSRYRP
jgi:hypothetical protein